MPPHPTTAPKSGVTATPAPRTAAPGPLSVSSASYEMVKVRMLIRLQEKLDPARARRMPESLMRQTARQLVEQMADNEARLPKDQRDRIIEDVLAEAFWVCPFEELFRDPGVGEILVVNPQVVLARRGQGWVPTNTKLRDPDHLRMALVKLADVADGVGDGLPDSAFDCQLRNGFRMVAVLPPAGFDFTPTATFVRVGDAPPPATQSQFLPKPAKDPGSNVPGFRAPGGGTGTFPAVPPASPPRPPAGGTGSFAAVPTGSQTHRPLPPAVTPAPTPAAVPPEAGFDPKLTRYRVRITERIIARLSELGVFDLSGLDVRELQKVVSAYVVEYCKTEKVLLADGEQSRLILEIITSMRR